MKTPNFAEFIRKQYPPGTRLRLLSMDDPYHPLPRGTEGTVKLVDDIGSIFVKWDNGSGLALVPGVDNFTVIEQKQEMIPLTLYMPLHCDLYTYDRYGDLEDEPEVLDGCASREYADNILAALERYRNPEERERGLMYWYQGKDSVNDKVHSAEFSVEERSRTLWGVVKCVLKGELNRAELQTFENFISGQASDGWGEGFEQREIKVSDGALYAHLWDWGDDWHIMTESEFVERYEQSQSSQLGYGGE